MNKYAVIGNPIKHSKSPQIHTAFAQQENVNIDYQRIQADKNKFISTVNQFVKDGGLGLNVTIPFKVKAYEQCLQLNKYAKAAQAVNTISFDPNTGWLGANTDGIGLLKDLKNNLNLQIRDKNILILGAGGATRGILLPLLKEAPTQILLANRTISKAIDLANAFSSEGNIDGCGFKDIDTQAFDVIINATSASLDNNLPAVPETIISTESVCYDLAYSDKPTAFIEWSNKLNAKLSIDGIGMLIEQAAESYYIWRNFRPDTKPVFKLLRPKS
ncbi:MAG: shikimate dehydrogenase [Gammaproteobacteria bacterium]|nr:shikimate dehydrogenase [Gammaproteobacteria bacterium]